MASVQYLFSQTNALRVELTEKTLIFSWLSKFRDLCALVIQKAWRSYACRRYYLRIRKAIITIQSYYRGWVVRKSKALYEAQHALDMEHLGEWEAAVKIQAWYRGHLVRKYLAMKGGTPKQRVERLKNMNEMAKDMQDYIKEEYQKNTRAEKECKDESAKKKALFSLFKWHHLIRTKLREGVYSCHRSDKLSIIEELMKVFPFKEYMDNLHKCYKNAVRSERPPYYFFHNEKLRQFEDLLKLRDRSRDIKSDTQIISSPTIPFDLDTHLLSKPYERSMFATDRYTKRIEILTHNDEIKQKNVCDEPFQLDVKHLDLKDRTIPYFIDYFESKKCEIHYPHDIVD